jgi:Uma2 family endonuclease
MVQSLNKHLTLEEFFALLEGDVTYEFINGEAVPKYKDEEMSATIPDEQKQTLGK